MFYVICFQGNFDLTKIDSQFLSSPSTVYRPPSPQEKLEKGRR